MRIGVLVSGWEQSCCGTPFRVGDDVVWELCWAREAVAASYGPDEAAGVDFAETHHGGDDELGTVRVAGRVESIRAMSQRMHRPDPAGPWTNVDGEATGLPVEQVPGRTRIDPDELQPPPTRVPDPVAAGGWYAQRNSRHPRENEPAERRTDAGWIVQLDVTDHETLPEAPTPAS